MTTPRQSRVVWPSVSSYTSALDDAAVQQVRSLIDEFGLALEDAAASSKVNVFAFPLFRPFNVIGGVTPAHVLVAISPIAGGMATVAWHDWRNNTPAPKPADLAVSVRQQPGWDQFEILSFDSALLGQASASREPRLREIAREKVNGAIEAAEREARLVRLNPIFHGRDFTVEDDLCFVLMPFSEPFLRIYEDHVKPTLEAAGLKVMKADDIFTPTAIVDDIWEYVNRARLLVADVTGRNPNVYYELGMAHTVGKEVIILTQGEGDVPFDLRHLRHFTYTDNEEGWESLKHKLAKAIDAIVGKRK